MSAFGGLPRLGSETLDDKVREMEPRLNLLGSATVGRAMQQLAAASTTLAGSPALPASLRALVLLRASQINGCGYCTDMHGMDALAAGERPARLNLVATWRESTVFSDAERAALELTEQGTRIADAAGGVCDTAWAAAAAHYDEEQLGLLTALIAFVNAANRLGVINRQPGGGSAPAR
jgi:AhpD family alkylhydroperoxidase